MHQGHIVALSVQWGRISFGTKIAGGSLQPATVQNTVFVGRYGNGTGVHWVTLAAWMQHNRPFLGPPRNPKVLSS